MEITFPKTCLWAAGAGAVVAGATAWAGASLAVVVTAIAFAALALIVYGVIRVKPSLWFKISNVVEHSNELGSIRWSFMLGNTPIEVQEDNATPGSLYEALKTSIQCECHWRFDCFNEKNALAWLNLKSAQKASYPEHWGALPPPGDLLLPLIYDARAGKSVTGNFQFSVEAIRKFLAAGNTADKITILFITCNGQDWPPIPKDFGIDPIPWGSPPLPLPQDEAARKLYSRL